MKRRGAEPGADDLGSSPVLRDVNEREAEGRALTRHASLFNRV